MAFVNWVLNNPGYAGIEDPEEVGVENRPANLRLESILDTEIKVGDMGLLLSPLYNPDNTAVNGWQVIGSGGGECPECPPGGSPRPVDGMLYPRGQG